MEEKHAKFTAMIEKSYAALEKTIKGAIEVAETALEGLKRAGGVSSLSVSNAPAAGDAENLVAEAAGGAGSGDQTSPSSPVKNE